METGRPFGLERSRRAGQRGGFALVVTISLMVLLTVLAFGLLTLSASQLRNSGLDAHRQQARFNARLALVIAIGEMQEQIGPDRGHVATCREARTDTGRQAHARAGRHMQEYT